MSVILARIKEDLKIAMLREVEYRKEKVSTGTMYEAVIATKTVARAIISMFPEINVKPNEATDDDTLKLLKRYINNEKIRELFTQKYLGEADVKDLPTTQFNSILKETIAELGDKLTSMNIGIAQTYLPKAITEDELAIWIRENIDFSVYKNKMQAMGPIMSNFKGLDGNLAKKVLMSL